MKALYCVDFLSHKWASDDLVCSYREIRKKLAVLSHQAFLEDALQSNNSVRSRRRESLRNKEQHRALVEEYKYKRLENALWRSMSRACTPNLGAANALVDPEDINWQKGSDITWLYGPFYQSEQKPAPLSISSLCSTPASSPHFEYPVPAFLKPALKKREPEHDMDDLLASIWGFDPAIASGAAHNPEPIVYHGNRRTTWPDTSYDKKAIRFNPNVTRLVYVPSSPVVRLSTPRKDKPRQQSLSKSPGNSGTSSSSWLPPSPPPSPPLDAANGHFLDLDLLVPESCDDGGGESVIEGEDDSDDNDHDDGNDDNDGEYGDEDGDDYDYGYRSENQQSALSLTQVATNVKDLAVLCGAIVVYKGISITVSPIAWMAERLVGKD